MTIYSTLRAWFNHPLNQIKEEITALGESSIWGGFLKKTIKSKTKQSTNIHVQGYKENHH